MIQKVPYIEVGVLFAEKIHFRLNGTYRAGGKAYEGEYGIYREKEKYWL